LICWLEEINYQKFGSKKELKMLKLELDQRRVAFIGERSSSERSFLREDATEERERER